MARPGWIKPAALPDTKGTWIAGRDWFIRNEVRLDWKRNLYVGIERTEANVNEWMDWGKVAVVVVGFLFGLYFQRRDYSHLGKRIERRRYVDTST